MIQNTQYIFLLILLLSCATTSKGTAEKSSYLKEIKKELAKEWPNNKTINIVFHGHSVPSGYFKTPVVNTFDSYPYQFLKKVKEQYPYAVINIINTAIGGEHSVSGAARFENEVLTHQPDILFIDYALNDIGIGLEAAKTAWNTMIKKSLKNDIKLFLLTPSPDQRINILEENNKLEQHRNQIALLASKYGIGYIDSYNLFKEKVIAGDSIANYMSQVNHPNKKGHQLISDEIMTYFE